jgi:hypothetical protein
VITPDRWREFLGLVRDTRRLQLHYRRTVCPLARRELTKFEEAVDLVAAQLDADLAAEHEAAAAAVRPVWLLTAEQARPEGGAA